jgi:glutamine synthetase
MSAKDVFQLIKDKDVKFVDLRFTDTRGKEQHVSVPVSAFGPDKFEAGHFFDGSSIAGWKGIQASDMVLLPDPTSYFIDPFLQQTTLAITCDVIEPSDGKGYDRDPRSIAKRGRLPEVHRLAKLRTWPEPEFFIFDSVEWNVGMQDRPSRFFRKKAPGQPAKLLAGNKGHRPSIKGGIFRSPWIHCRTYVLKSAPSSSGRRCCWVHHHEVANAGSARSAKVRPWSTCRLNMRLKYASTMPPTNGKTATFMPKPIVGDNGSGMVHQSIWKNGETLLGGEGYADCRSFYL